MSRSASLGVVLLSFALHGLAREVDRAVGLLLHSTLDLPGFVPIALSLVDPAGALRSIAAWAAVGALAWLGLAALRRGITPDAEGWGAHLSATAGLFAPLLLRPALTLLALLALAVAPAYPYGFTLPVALTQDWGYGQDAAAAAALAVNITPLLARALAPVVRPLAGVDWRPRVADVFLLAFLTFGLLAPEGARAFEAHPGNEPKYLRMALALGHGLTLDVDTVTAPMEELRVEPLQRGAARALRRLLAEPARLARDLSGGARVWDAAANGARGAAHLTVRGTDGGAYHVLAPGPALLLAPALRFDRAWNRARGTPGRIGLTLLLWNALAAAVVAATFRLARAVARSTGLAALVAAAVALSPPLLFYSFQFYPEVPAAGLLAWSAHRLVFGAPLGGRAGLLLGCAVAALPWLHQKYLPLALVLGAWAVLRAVDALVPGRALALLLAPPALSAAAFALYNFALTGLVRPDALFLALGREGVGLDHVGQGALGLLLDARYGLLPYVPWLLLAAAGLWRREARALHAAAPAAWAYFFTVAAAENWTGSISNLGRFLLPLVPLLAAGVALALRAAHSPGPALLTLTLAAWSARLANLLWADPLAANDSGVLLASSAFADGNVYLPTLLLRAWSDAAPALPAQLAAWALLVAGLIGVFRPRPPAARRATASRGLACLALALLAVGFALERWPGRRGQARFVDGLALDAETTLFVSGAARVEQGGIVATGGTVELLLRAARAPAAQRFWLDGPASVAVGAGQRQARPSASLLELPFDTLVELRGRRGRAQTLARQRLHIHDAERVTLTPLGDSRPWTSGSAPSVSKVD